MILCFIADGRSIHTQRWIQHFAEKGHEVHLITYDPMNKKIPGVTEHILTSRWENLYLAFPGRHLGCRKIVNAINPDIVHAHFITKYGFHLLGLEQCPRVVSAWGDDILILPDKSKLIKIVTGMVLRTSDYIYGVSYDICNRIILDYDISPGKIERVPFGIDVMLFSPNPRNNKDTIEVYSNRGFDPVYNTETLVRGFHAAYLKEPGLRLTLRGSGKEEEQVRELISNLKLEDIVTTKPPIPNDQIPYDLHRADIFVSTAISDGTPVSVLEAMACELPVIATDVGGVPEWIEDGKNGVLVTPGSATEVKEAILLLSHDKGLGKLLGAEARKTIIKDGQWLDHVGKAEALYRRLALK